MSNCQRMHFNLLKSILVVQFVLSIVEPIEHTIGNTVFKDIGRLEFQVNIFPEHHFSVSFESFGLLTLIRIFRSLEEVFRKSDLFNKISNEPKNYTIRYKYSKKDVGGGISYTRFNILGAEVDTHRLTNQFVWMKMLNLI